MSNYTEKELDGFRKKDKRISIQGLVQTLINSGRNANEVKENCELAKAYSDEIERLVNGVSCEKEQKEVKQEPKREVMWNDVACELNLPSIKVNNVKALDSLWNKCKSKPLLKVNPTILLKHIWDNWHKYPTTEASVETILKTLT